MSIHGFWISDPGSGGLGDSTYVTARYFTEEYFMPLDVPGDYFDGKYVAVTDPPENVSVREMAERTATDIVFSDHPVGFSKVESRLVRCAVLRDSVRLLANHVVVHAAHEAALSVVRYSDFSGAFMNMVLHRKPVYIFDECVVEFRSGQSLVCVTIGALNGELRQIQIITI